MNKDVVTHVVVNVRKSFNFLKKSEVTLPEDILVAWVLLQKGFPDIQDDMAYDILVDARLLCSAVMDKRQHMG